MVTIHFKLSSVGKVEQKLGEPASWKSLLERCAVKYGVEKSGIMAVRNGKVLTPGDLISEDDIINVFPAISGG